MNGSFKETYGFENVDPTAYVRSRLGEGHPIVEAIDAKYPVLIPTVLVAILEMQDAEIAALKKRVAGLERKLKK